MVDLLLSLVCCRSLYLNVWSGTINFLEKILILETVFGDDFGEDTKIGVSKVEPEVSPIGEVLEVVFRPKK